MNLCLLRRSVPFAPSALQSWISPKNFYHKVNKFPHYVSTLNFTDNLSLCVRKITTTPCFTSRIGKGRRRTLSKEDTRLSEVITIYEKLTKSKDRSDANIFRFAEETKMNDANSESATILDFSKFRDIYNQNYTYFSAATGLIQAHALHTLQWKYSTSRSSATTEVTSNFSDLIFNSKQFCLGIVNPTEDDLALLKTHLHVHDLTLRDIREQNTEEKVEVFKNYTFISLKVYLEAAENQTDPLPRGKKEDLNILMFPDPEIAIILHYGTPWCGFKDVLGFLNLLCNYGNSTLTPDWVLFSIIIELMQDAKFAIQQLEPKILNLKIANSDSVHMPSRLVTDLNGNATDLSQVLTKNFANEFEIYKINRFVKPKIKVLKELEFKENARFSPKVLNLLSGTRKELEEVGEALGNFNHILERSQDTCLTLANVRQSQEANRMGGMMKRLSEVALLFLPLQAIAGLLGMNVKIPLQGCDSTLPFWGIIAASSAMVIILYRFNRAVSTKNCNTK
ncbi:putative metal ion transporter C27B12.12c [Pseudolycoriella hygida]|uniref:Metal ion transporter C27B12.12c n=1 Tax=Pseudolycoriella hygida TaxID=35572 RepID=A0A9Q0NHM6_9DIPT|nr:putative metal ion transporter C27B12.12c [Pseudolycoriella hygida]